MKGLQRFFTRDKGGQGGEDQDKVDQSQGARGWQVDEQQDDSEDRRTNYLEIFRLMTWILQYLPQEGHPFSSLYKADMSLSQQQELMLTRALATLTVRKGSQVVAITINLSSPEDIQVLASSHSDANIPLVHQTEDLETTLIEYIMRFFVSQNPLRDDKKTSTANTEPEIQSAKCPPGLNESCTDGEVLNFLQLHG